MAYCIITEATAIDLYGADKAEHLRHNLAGDLCVSSYQQCVKRGYVPDRSYTAEEIMVIMDGPEWSDPNAPV